MCYFGINSMVSYKLNISSLSGCWDTVIDQIIKVHNIELGLGQWTMDFGFKFDMYFFNYHFKY